MLRSLFLVPCLLLAALGSFTSRAQQPDAAPVDSDATPGARALLRQIDTVSGHGILSGQHNFPNTVSRYSDRILELTGSYPAVFGQDFGFSGGEDKDSALGRPSMIEEVIRQYHRGAVIALTWHAVRPTEDEPVTFRDSVQGHLTDWEWEQLLTPGTNLHTRWERQVDTIAGYLHELQDAGVPVLFRPYHEMNGNWFWWGGRPGPHGSQELYRQLFERYTHLHHLHNLVWVWNVNAPSGNAGPVEQYFPGPTFADVETMDIYGPFDQTCYNTMNSLAGPHKPIALAEVGAMPTLATLQGQPRWAYFMMWSGMAEGANTPEQLQTMFHAGTVVNRGDPRLGPAPVASAHMSPSPIDPKATPATHDLLTSLFAAPPGPAPTSRLSELTMNQRTAEDTKRELKRIHDAGQVALLRWTPPSPAGAGLHPLDDFEWNELRRPGTPLHAAWIQEVHRLAEQLAALNSGTALVLDALPQPNAGTFWWGNRPGPEGSEALLADLRAALAAADVHFILWAAEPMLAAPAPPARPVPSSSFFAGPLDFDLVLVDNTHPESRRGYGARQLHDLAGPKPVLANAPSS